MQMARVLVQPEVARYEVREVPIPDPGPDGAILAVEACGLCGSDVEAFRGVMTDLPFPLAPGHEALGRIEKIGSDAAAAWNLTEGDRVAVHSHLRCGRCRGCHTGSRCVAPAQGYSRAYGWLDPGLAPGLWGGMATHMYLAPETMTVPLDPAVPTANASFFNALANGVDWTQDVGNVGPSDRVAILGPGPRGLACLIAARQAGARRIAVVGLRTDRYRLDVARALGAVDVVADGTPLRDLLEDALGSRPDLIIDTTPVVTHVIEEAIRALSLGGRLVLAGLKGDASAQLPIDVAISNQIRILTGYGKSLAALISAVRIIESGEWPIEKIATHSFGLHEAEAAIEAVESGGDVVQARIEP
jgi:threonine dehydrogenase-like Zn-dependent dehydrogenase